jgi:hypothetical protein
MGCGCSNNNPQAYLACSSTTPLPLVDDSTYTNFAAQAGARSSDFTMCLAKAMLISRRMIYFKATPGDCGTQGYAISSPDLSVARGLGSTASLDPEPISKGILSGLAAIFGGFGAAHAQAVATEQSTLCQVAVTFNQTIQALEQYVSSGQLSPDQASAILAQVVAQLDPVMAKIAKPCDAACGYRIGMQALNNFMSSIGFTALAPQSSLQALSSVTTPPPASPGAAGTYGAPGGTAPLPGVLPPSSPLPSQSGISLNANNAGVGLTSQPGLPSSFPVGALVVIGGIVYIATRPGVRTAEMAALSG